MSTEPVAKNSSSVRKFVQDRLRLIEEVEAMQYFDDQGKVQVNVRLHSFNAFHLEHLADRLGMTRSELAVDLLTYAIADAWEELGLPSVFDNEELKQKSLAYIQAHNK